MVLYKCVVLAPLNRKALTDTPPIMQRHPAALRWACFALVFATAVVVECRPVEDPISAVMKKNAYEKVKLPGIDDFRHGLDYSTGNRKKSIFAFTYTRADAGDSSYLHYAALDQLTYKIPDQVDASNWASVCSSYSSTKSTTHSSFNSYQTSEGKSVNSEFDQKTDISVSVPVGSAEVGASTQTRNNLGYGRSSFSGDYASSMLSGKRSAAMVETFNARWSVHWKSYDSSFRPVNPTDHLTSDFQGSKNSLMSSCPQGSVDMAWRMSGGSGSGEWSSCEQAAARLVEDFGTHYNRKAAYGGRASQSYYYNEEKMTSSQKNSMSQTSKSSMGFLFFMHSSETTSGRSTMNTLVYKNVISESKLLIVGGDAGASNAGVWCNTVSKAPAIIGNTIIVPIADLFDAASAARAAVAYAAMDKWVCNGRGKYVNINRSSGAGSCKCDTDSNYHLDSYCAPLRPKCRSGGREAECHFEKILVTYANSYSLLWNDVGSGGDHDGSLYKPIVAANKALVGTVAVKGYTSPFKALATIDTSTSYKVARAAYSFSRVYADWGTGSDRDGSVYRPNCPWGYESVSDFGQAGYGWPGQFTEPLLPCVASRCVKQCYAQWVWNDADTGGDMDVTFWRIAGTSSELGSDVGRSGGFFRAFTNYSPAPTSYMKCIKPECVITV